MNKKAYQINDQESSGKTENKLTYLLHNHIAGNTRILFLVVLHTFCPSVDPHTLVTHKNCHRYDNGSSCIFPLSSFLHEHASFHRCQGMVGPFQVHLEVVFRQNKAFVSKMCFNEWNMNKQSTKVLLLLVSILLTNLKISLTREGPACDVNRGAMNHIQCQHKKVMLGAS